MSADDIHVLRLKLDQISAVQEAMAACQTEFSAQQARMMSALVGDNLGTTGIVKRLAAQEQLTEQIDRKLLRWGSLVAGASFTLALFKDALLSLFHR